MANVEKPGLPEWQQYPTFAELLTDHDKYVELRQRCVRSCQQLDDLVKNGSAEQRIAAQQSINAYGLALKTLDEAVAARDKYIEKQGS